EYADVGQGVVYAGTDLMRVDRTIEAVLRELDRLRREPVPEEELRRTKALRKGRIQMGLEDSRSVAAWIGGQELIFGEILTPEQGVEQVGRVTSEDRLDRAAELVQPQRLNLALVGAYEDAGRFQPLLTLEVGRGRNGHGWNAPHSGRRGRASD